MEDLGEAIRRARLARGMSLTAVAKAAYVTKGYLSLVEHGRKHPSAQVLRALGEALGVDLRAAGPRPYPGEVAATSQTALVPVLQPDGSVIVMQMDRRAFLATATVTAAATAVPIALPDRANRDVLVALSDRLHWHAECGRWAHPDVVSRAVRADLDRVTRLARDTPGALRGQALAVCARYAEYLGWMRQEAGDTTGAMRWTNHAADLAYAAGWRHMVAYTMTRKAAITLADEPKNAVDLARAARTGPWRLSPGLTAVAAAQEAEAHAQLGAAADSGRALGTALRALGRMDSANEPPLGPPMLRIADLPARVWSARCDVLLARHDQVIDVLGPIVAASPVTRGRAIDGARLARSYVGVGAVDEACQTAHDAARDGGRCASATARRELAALRPVLAPWSGRTDVDQVLAALPA